MKATLAALLLGSHLICVNLAAGGPLLAAQLDWRAHRHRDTTALLAARWLARASLLALLLGAGLGLALAGLRWSPQYRILWSGPLREKLFWATWEFLFSLLLLGGWGWCLPRSCNARTWPTLARGFAACLASSNLLYHFPFLFGVSRRLMDHGPLDDQPLPRAVFRSLMMQHELPALVTHVALASLAVAGGALLFLAWRGLRKQQGDEVQTLTTLGGRWALFGSLAQFPVGLWLLITLPPPVQYHLLGGNALATLLLLASLGLAVLLLFQLVQLLASPPTSNALLAAVATLVATILFMALLHEQARPRGQAAPSGTWGQAIERSQ